MIDVSELMVTAREQDGVLSRDQCLSTLRPDQIQRLVEGERWQRLHRGVYAIFTGPVPPRAALGAAVLATGRDARLIRETALWVDRPRGPLPVPEVGVPFGSPRLSVPGVRVSRLRNLPAPQGWPPRTPVERSVIDAADRLTQPARVIELVCSVVGDRRTVPARLVEELDARPRHRYRDLLLRLLADVAVGAQSPLELADLRNDRAHGLPAGVRQVKQRVDGVAQWQDVSITVAGSRGPVTLVKELDGRLGHESTGRFRDMRRDNASALRGALTLRFGWIDYEERRCEASALQVAVWARAGVSVGRRCGQPACRPGAFLR